MKKLYMAFVATVSLAAAGAQATTVMFAVQSYSMPNGNGQASGGTFNYWDLFYDGMGQTNVDGAFLEGGRGDLTDGFVAPTSWNLVENVAGTGPYVGWRRTATLDPTVDFNIVVTADGATYWLQEMRVHMDNSGIGGVFAPGAILVNGQSVDFVAPALGTVGWVTIGGLSGDAGNNGISVQFRHGGEWVFISEVQFFGLVPEPASWAMLIAGFGLVGGMLRRRPISA